MAFVAIVAWLAWHVWQCRFESNTYKEDIEKHATSENLEKVTSGRDSSAAVPEEFARHRVRPGDPAPFKMPSMRPGRADTGSMDERGIPGRHRRRPEHGLIIGSLMRPWAWDPLFGAATVEDHQLTGGLALAARGSP